MKSVLQNIIAKYLADDYGLVFSSHGSVLIPGTKSFGSNDSDKVATLEIKDISANLPVKFKFLIFDACIMADITTIYQIRSNADHSIASVAPVPGHGFNYDEYLYKLLQKERIWKDSANRPSNRMEKQRGVPWR